MSDDIKYKNVLCISLFSNVSDFAIGFSMVVSVLPCLVGLVRTEAALTVAKLCYGVPRFICPLGSLLSLLTYVL